MPQHFVNPHCEGEVIGTVGSAAGQGNIVFHLSTVFGPSKVSRLQLAHFPRRNLAGLVCQRFNRHNAAPMARLPNGRELVQENDEVWCHPP